MRTSGVGGVRTVRTVLGAAVATALALATLTSCSSAENSHAKSGREDGGSVGKTGGKGGQGAEQRTQDLTRLPDVGTRLHRRIPADSRQALVVRGEGEDSADSTVFLYEKHGKTWDRTRSWPAHNGKRGWTTDHREGDKRSPVGVFTLSDAGGVLAAPDARLPYTESPAFQASRAWPKTHWHDFDHVIAIDYNRVKGTPPNDPNRPQGQSKGGYIWLHLDHGSGTSGCVSVSKSAMQYLLRELDPKAHPVIVMGDKGNLADS
ncbi:L,D-transpeptidase family protein [Streptomyces sp. Da 82-17]|uniref:L,D-transpeptidase family protein n=1 Tax=Streptomyces sp. Da 82-17 TaxID=3377116 RepID=UPI0038D39B9D